MLRSVSILSTSATEASIRIRPTTIVYFTDAHNQPSLPLDRFRWLAAYVNDVKPTHFVDGGDFDDLPSLCRHVRNESYAGKFKPTYQADLEAAAQAREILGAGIKVNVSKHVTLGNHEHRLWDYENENPEVYGMMQHAYMSILETFGWAVTPYKAYLNIDGVDFTHIPIGTMGKPVGGKTPCNIISRDSIRDVCFGHTHGLGLQINHKLGPSRSVTAFNGGCFMPDGYVPDYAQNTQKHFWYGAHTLTIENERLHIQESITMRELERRYT
jgi:hypothetical protein